MTQEEIEFLGWKDDTRSPNAINPSYTMKDVNGNVVNLCFGFKRRMLIFGHDTGKPRTIFVGNVDNADDLFKLMIQLGIKRKEAQ